jgi:hypothetical protein
VLQTLVARVLINSGAKPNKSKQLHYRHFVQIKTTNKNGDLIILMLVNVLLIKGKSINDAFGIVGNRLKDTTYSHCQYTP